MLELSDEDGKGKGRFAAALRYYQQLEDAIVDAANASTAPTIAINITVTSANPRRDRANFENRVCTRARVSC